MFLFLLQNEMLDKLKKSKPTPQAASAATAIKSPGAGTPANSQVSGPSPSQTAAVPKAGSGRKTTETPKAVALAVDTKPSIRKRKQKIISTGLKGLNPKERLYCVCKKPYDDRK